MQGQSQKDMSNETATTLWRMYSKAKAGLPYRSRMENLTWRLMYLNMNKPQHAAVEATTTSATAGYGLLVNRHNSSSNLQLNSGTPNTADFASSNWSKFPQSQDKQKFHHYNPIASPSQVIHHQQQQQQQQQTRPPKFEFDYLDHIKSLSNNESYLHEANKDENQSPTTKDDRITKEKSLHQQLHHNQHQQQSKLSQSFQNHHLVNSPRDSHLLRNMTLPSSPAHSFSNLNHANSLHTSHSNIGLSRYNQHHEYISGINNQNLSNSLKEANSISIPPPLSSTSTSMSIPTAHPRDILLSNLSQSASPTAASGLGMEGISQYTFESISIPTNFTHQSSISSISNLQTLAHLDTKENETDINDNNESLRTPNFSHNLKHLDFFDTPIDQMKLNGHDMNTGLDQHSNLGTHFDNLDFNNNRELSINHNNNLNFDIDGDLNMFENLHNMNSHPIENINTDLISKSLTKDKTKQHSSSASISSTNTKVNKKQTSSRRKSTVSKKKRSDSFHINTTPTNLGNIQTPTPTASGTNLNNSSALSTPGNNQTPSTTDSPNKLTPSGSQDNSDAVISCANCHTKTTPLWRRNPEGQSLCNACGLFLKLHGVVRPLSLKTDVIKKRQRGSGSTKKRKSQSQSQSQGQSSGSNPNPSVKSDGDDANPAPIIKQSVDNVDDEDHEKASNLDNHLNNEESNNQVTSSDNVMIMNSLGKSPQIPKHNQSFFTENFDMMMNDDSLLNHPTSLTNHDQHFDAVISPNISNVSTHQIMNHDEKDQNWDWLNMQI